MKINSDGKHSIIKGQDNKTQHTPIPWDVMEGKTLFHIETANKGDGSPCGMHIASVGKSRSGRADAAFIVKCVNSQEELLWAAKLALNMVQTDIANNPSAHSKRPELEAKLREIVTKAEATHE